MYIKESEIRKLIRKKLIQEGTAGSAGTAGKDLAAGLAAGLGTAVAIEAGTGAALAGAAAVGSSGLAGLSASVLGSGAWAGVVAGGPAMWVGAGVIGLGIAAYYMFDHAEGGKIANKVLSGDFYQQYKNVCLEISNNFSKQGNAELAGKWKSQPQTISNQEADAFAERLYEATKGGFLDMGLGTDEDEIKKVLNEIPTCVDVSFVSVKFAETYKGSWTFDANLLNVFNEELDQGDFSKYVESPLADKMNTALINIFGTVVGQDQWAGYVDSAKAVVDEAEKAAAEAEDNVKTELEDDDEGSEDSVKGDTYTTSKTDPWEYKVSEDTGCWLTRKKEDAPVGAFKSLGNNARATRILDQKFPDARTADQKADCPATGGGSGGGSRRGSISRKGAEERAKRASLGSKNIDDIRINITGPLKDNKNIEEFRSEFRQVIVDTLPASKKIPNEYSIKINTGPRGRVQFFRSNWDGIDEKGLSAQVRKMITGRRKTRGTIDVTIPAGDYSTLNEGAELKALIKKLSRKV